MPNDPLAPSLDDIASMTHGQPQQPPAPPIYQSPLRDQFNQGGLMGLLTDNGILPQSWKDNWLNRLVHSQAMEDASGFLGNPLIGATLTKAWGPVAHPFEQGATVSRMHILDKDGKQVGYWFLTHRPDGTLKTNMISSRTGPLALGSSEMRSLGPELKREFPNATSLTGHRVTGARYGKAANKTRGIEDPAIPLPAYKGDKPPTSDSPPPANPDRHDMMFGYLNDLYWQGRTPTYLGAEGEVRFAPPPAPSQEMPAQSPSGYTSSYASGSIDKDAALANKLNRQ